MRRGTHVHLSLRAALIHVRGSPDDFDPVRDMARYMSTPKAREWDELMRSFQEPVEGGKPGETWVQMKEVYVLDALTDQAGLD